MIKNEDLEIMIKVEYLLMSHNRTDMFQELDINGKCYFNDIEITDDDINKYWNLIERIKKDKKERNEKVKVWNKKNNTYHRITNNISNNRVSGNLEKMKYWQEKLKEYKETR